MKEKHGVLGRKYIDFLSARVCVMLTDCAPEGFREEAVAGVYGQPKDGNIFGIWFNGLVCPDEVVHECWHLFMSIMATADDKEHIFLELNDEIYAYSFHTLFNDVLDAVTGLKAYKELWDKEQKKGRKK